MLTMFILLGKWLEARAKRHTCSVLTQLMAMAPDTACLVTLADDGTVIAEQHIDARLVQRGDTLQVLTGQKVPADGELIEVWALLIPAAAALSSAQRRSTTWPACLASGAAVPDANGERMRACGGELLLLRLACVPSLCPVDMIST